VIVTLRLRMMWVPSIMVKIMSVTGIPMIRRSNILKRQKTFALLLFGVVNFVICSVIEKAHDWESKSYTDAKSKGSQVKNAIASLLGQAKSLGNYFGGGNKTFRKVRKVDTLQHTVTHSFWVIYCGKFVGALLL